MKRFLCDFFFRLRPDKLYELLLNKSFLISLSFFSKLKEKEKNPSKTPYLDTKFWKTSYDVTKFVTNDTNSKSPIHKRSSKMPLFNKSQSSKKKKNYMDENDNNKEKIFIQKESNKRSLDNNKDDNNAIINNKKDLQKKEIKRHENNDNSNESEYCLECKGKVII